MTNDSNKELQIPDEKMRELHKCTQEILDVLVNICNTNGIKYYLMYGTLLGAVRHNGPIPWDDDLDVCMPREDFEKFKRIMLSRADDEKYYIHCFENDSGSPRATAKLRKRGTICLTRFDADIKAKFSGVWIDIFPLDDSGGTSLLRMRLLGWAITYMKMLLNTKALQTKNMKSRRKLIRILLSPISLKQMHGMIEKLMEFENKKGYTYYVSYGSRYNYKTETMPKKWYGDPVKLLYSGKYYDAPCEWDKILKHLYGDYWQLPPESERGGHGAIEVNV